MGTRSCVAKLVRRENGDLGFEGQYIHWDGYPEGVGQTLYNEAKRLGTSKVLEVMLNHDRGWSSVAGALLDRTPLNLREMEKMEGQKREELAKLYGHDFTKIHEEMDKWHEANGTTNCPVYHPGHNGLGDEPIDPWIVDEKTDAGMEWAYVFEQKEDGRWIMHVLASIMPDGSKVIGMFGMSPADWRGTWKEVAAFDLSTDETIDWEKVGAYEE